MPGIDKWRNHKLNLVAKVRTRDGQEAFVEHPSLRRLVLGKGKAYLYVKTDRGQVNTIYERRPYVAEVIEIVDIFDKKAKKTMQALSRK